MTYLKCFLFLAICCLVQLPSIAQDWTSYRSLQQVNDLVDTGTELLLATDAGLVVVNKLTLEKTIFTVDNSNLSNNHIQSITKAPNGSLWIGTYDVVLARFDGTDFENPTVPAAAELMPGALLYDLEFAPNGDVWVGTDQGLFRRQGTDWVYYGEEALDASFVQAWDIEITDAGEVLVGSRDVHRFADDTWTNLSDTTNFIGYADAELFCASNGDLYFAGDLDRVARFDGTQWREYEFDGITAGEVVSFTEDTDGNVYLNTLRNGIFQLIDDTWMPQEDVQTESFNNLTSYLYFDDNNHRWLNHNIYLSVQREAELSTIRLSPHTIEYDDIEHLHRGQNDALYFITQTSTDSMAVLADGGRWSSLPLPVSILDLPGVLDIEVIADDNIWLTKLDGLYHYDGEGWTFEDTGIFSAMATDAVGRMYLLYIDRILILENGTSTQYNSNNSPITQAAGLSSIGFDADDNLWVAARNASIIQRRSPNGTWTTYTSADHPAIARPNGDFYFDAAGHVWIPSELGGALKFDGNNWTNPLLESAEEIDDLYVYSITQDFNGRLYFAYQYGAISLLDDTWEQLPIPELEADNLFYQSQITTDSNGTLWWAGENYGVYALVPDAPSSASFITRRELSLNLYPNPTTDYFTLETELLANAQVVVSVYNELGQIVFHSDQGELPSGNFRKTFDARGLVAGIYSLEVKVDQVGYVSRLVVVK